MLRFTNEFVVVTKTSFATIWLYACFFFDTIQRFRLKKIATFSVRTN